jgi:cytochrome c
MKLRIALAALALLGVSSSAMAQGDAAKGQNVFKRCQVCHVHDTKTNKVGPHLGDVVGRKAGSVEGFKYSDAMKKRGRRGSHGPRRTSRPISRIPRPSSRATRWCSSASRRMTSLPT